MQDRDLNRRGPGVARCWFSAALLTVAWTAVWPASAAQQKLVPANFGSKTDSQGFIWDINTYGAIGNGTNSCFSHSAMLTVNNNSFSTPQSRLMTADGSEYVLTRQMSGLEVTRRVKVDLKAAAVRYVEMFRNPTSAPITAGVMLQTHMGRGPGTALVTDTGAPAGTTLGQKDSGLILIGNAAQGQLSVLFHLGGPRSKIKPSIQNQQNYQFHFNYNVTVPAGKTVSIMHGVAQRRLAAIPNAKAAGELFKSFNGRDWTRDLPRAVRRSIVNLGKTSFGGWGDRKALVSLESLGVERQAADVLAVGDQTKLHGTVACNGFQIATDYGDLKLPLEKIAAIVGEKRTGATGRVFLVDGQVLSGSITVEDLSFTLNSGLKLDLTPETVDRLVMRAGPEDGKPADEVVAILETVEGDRLALLKGDDQTLGATTPWGRRPIPLGDIERISATEQKVGHRLLLKDGSRLFAFLDGSILSLKTFYFGTQKFSPLRVRGLTAAHMRSEEDSPDEIAAAHVLLAGDNVLIGRIDLPSIHFLTSDHKIPVPPNQIRVLRNVTGESNDDTRKGAWFEAQLWDGGVVAGALGELVVPVRCSDRVAEVPMRDILEVHLPTPTVPDSMRSKIAQFIRDLAHPQYSKRKAAKEALTELGHLPKLQLDEALRTTSDPEVRRSVEALLEELQE